MSSVATRTRVVGLAPVGGRDRRAMTTAMMTEAIAAGTAWVWKTSRLGASFVWVSMIANRISTLIAPM